MSHAAIFFEAWDSHNYSDLQICRKTMRNLLKLGVTPLPFASKLDDLQLVLKSLSARGMEPGIFVINTFWAEELLLQMDPLMPEHSPALFFRRGLCTDTRSRDLLAENPAYGNTSVALNQMMPRLASVWEYGKLSADAVAEKAAGAITRFLREGNFHCIEALGAQAARS